MHIAGQVATALYEKGYLDTDQIEDIRLAALLHDVGKDVLVGEAGLGEPPHVDVREGASGGAGAPLYGVDASCYHTLITESVRHWLIVDVADRSMTVTAWRIDGTMLDTFTLTK